MGAYLNPGNVGFAEISNSGYIDKTGMIEIINQRINTTDKLICVSRPRRFGKSYAAQMLCRQSRGLHGLQPEPQPPPHPLPRRPSRMRMCARTHR